VKLYNKAIGAMEKALGIKSVRNETLQEFAKRAHASGLKPKGRRRKLYGDAGARADMYGDIDRTLSEQNPKK